MLTALCLKLLPLAFELWLLERVRQTVPHLIKLMVVERKILQWHHNETSLNSEVAFVLAVSFKTQSGSAVGFLLGGIILLVWSLKAGHYWTKLFVLCGSTVMRMCFLTYLFKTWGSIQLGSNKSFAELLNILSLVVSSSADTFWLGFIVGFSCPGFKIPVLPHQYNGDDWISCWKITVKGYVVC